MSEKKITPIHYEILIKIFELDGFVIRPRLAPVTHIRTNMTTAGMLRERFFELLEKG
jgi:hypothetical protein